MKPILFISVSILCEFYMLPNVDILLSPQEEKVYSSSWDVHVLQRIYQKD